MDYSKIIGWIVFAGGLAVIIWTLLTSYNIFTGERDIPIFFGQESQIQETSSSGDIQGQIENLAREQIAKMIPLDAIPTMFNLAVWSAFAFIFIFGGFQIASLGVKLIKK